MSTALDAAEVEIHRQNLAKTTDFRVFPLFAETVLWAIFTVLIVTSTHILLSRGLRSRSSQVMLTLTLVMYVLSTLDWAIDVRRVWTDLKISLPAELSSPARDEDRLNKANVALPIIQSVTNNVCTLISDVVVCWRVCVVYGQDKRVIGMAVALLLALASGLLLCNLTQIGLGFPSVVRLHVLAPGELPIDIVTLILSAVVNIWATGMIAYRAWTCRREIRLYFQNSSQSFTESVLTLFVETGTIYTILWILKNIIILPVVEDTSYTDYAAVVMYQVTGMYPTVIIILVTLQRSHLEYQFTYPGFDGHNATLSFSAQVPQSWSTGTNQLPTRRATIREMQFAPSSSGGSSGFFGDKLKADATQVSEKEVLKV